MNKYIPAEKLIAEIEKRQEYLGDHNFHSMASEYDWLLTMVQSLQQEQPEGLHFTPLNRLIQKIPFERWNDTVNNYAKKLRDCLIKEGYLKDAKVLQNYISYMNGNNVPMATMDEQEQPVHSHYTKVRETKTGRVFLAEYSSEAAEWYEAGTGKAYSISDVEIVKLQPEVDLDSALTGFMGRYAYENSGEYPSAIDIARHFYELGKNARKEK